MINADDNIKNENSDNDGATSWDNKKYKHYEQLIEQR